ncbi:hypothetical protein LguiA_020734 [Lonicera macranthoides]
MTGGGEEGTTLEYTPTWYLKRKNQKPLYEALQKVKEVNLFFRISLYKCYWIDECMGAELMLLGFISLLLTVFQNGIVKICVKEDVLQHLLPCPYPGKDSSHGGAETTSHYRHLLAEESAKVGYCAKKIRQWKNWEDSIGKDNFDTEEVLKSKVTSVHQHEFIKDRFVGIGKRSVIFGWMHSFFKQFTGSVTKSDYVALRLGFITTHCKRNPKFNFHKYMIRALEDDFRKVVGISWYLWVFVMIFLLLNINGWHTYFWIAFIPFIMLLAVGTKLEHIISQLAHEVAEKHIAIEGELVVQPSDEHFWFSRPRIVLYLIHFILFQNAFEIAFFFWILVQYGFDSCIMGQVRFIVPRLIIG